MKKAIYAFCLMVFFECGACAGPAFKEILGKLTEKYDSITDYQCRLNEWCTSGKKVEDRVINFYFKKPRNIRMDILKGTKAFDSGSSGVYTGGNTVVGHKGGILTPVALKVSKHDGLATTIRGLTFDQSDMQETVEILQFHLQNSSVTVRGLKEEVYEITCIPPDPAKNDGISKDVIWIDMKLTLPVFNERYEGNAVVQRARWSNYIINAGLPDELFRIRFNPAKLSEQGINSIHGLGNEK